MSKTHVFNIGDSYPSLVTQDFCLSSYFLDLSSFIMKLNITRTKKTENVSVEDKRVTAIRKESQLDVNLELSDVSESLIKFLKKHL